MNLCKVRKPFVSAILASVVAVVPFMSTVASAAEPINKLQPAAVAVTAAPPSETSFVDTNYKDASLPGEITTRGTSAPSSYWNLVNTYNGSANFAYNIYTNYYFSPNTSGEIYNYFYADWDPQFKDAQFIRIDCYEKSSGSVVTSHTTNGTAYSDVENTVKFYNLDVNKFYYFKYTKLNDEVYINMNFSIYR